MARKAKSAAQLEREISAALASHRTITKTSSKTSSPKLHPTEIVARIMKLHGFDSDGPLHWVTRNHGNIVNERPGREDILSAKAARTDILAAIPGARVEIETVDEWVDVDITLPK